MTKFEVRYRRAALADLDSILQHIGQARGEDFARAFVGQIKAFGVFYRGRDVGAALKKRGGA